MSATGDRPPYWKELIKEHEERLRQVPSFRAKVEADERFARPLYHYCDARSMAAILSTGTFWGTNLRHMSDASELSYGARLVQVRIQQRVAAAETPAQKTILQDLARFADPFSDDSGYDVYAVCFSEEWDDMPQWRSYADGGRGYAIGIDTSRVRQELGVRGHSNERLFLGRVVYDVEEQHRLIDDLLEEGLRMQGEFHPEPFNGFDIQASQLVQAWRQLLGEVIPFLKNPAFWHEREWRVSTISLQPTDSRSVDPQVRFREHRGRLFPYMEFKTRPSKRGEPGGPLPLTRLVAGPLVPFHIEQPALHLLTARMEPKVKLDHSSLPLR